VPGPWTEAPIEQPAAVLDAPSLEPGYQCHPCHYLAENDLFAVTNWPSGFITVGAQKAATSQAIAFTSSDGTSWMPVSGFLGPDTSSAVSVASDGTRTVVVGLQHTGAIAWAFDGQTWQQAPDQDSLHIDYAAGGMTSVIAYQGGFVAGGYADDPLHLAASAAVWRSDDGLTWTRDQARAGVFDGGRIWSMTSVGDSIVAVGTTGNDPIYGPAGAWRWTAATGWQKAEFSPDDGGAISAVAVTTHGLIAVGKNSTDLGSSVWTSIDGTSWTALADQPAFHYYQLPLRMQALAVTSSGLLVGGWRSDVGKGSAVTWFAPDTRTWTAPVWETSFSGGEITGVAVSPDGSTGVAVGRTGYPDWDRATAWFRRAPY
jgi:hypothetical protein